MLEVSDLFVRYGRIEAVRGISLAVQKGEIVALLGPNGAGKTSLISAIMGLVPPATGTVRFEGKDVARLDVEDRVRAGMTLTPEGRHIFSNLTVAENLMLGAATRKKAGETNEDREKMLDMFPVLRERYRQLGGTLSGGEQQMLAIARSLMCRPKLLMLDEPSLGLAPRIVDQIFQLITNLRGFGLTILLVEQNAHEALKFADRAYIISTGRIEFSGPAQELRESKDLMQAYLAVDVV
ncbi:MAG: ABC transporter ATP-binding protein [Dongiaceae bacterium]|nr:ABC transporter ATP-binding protein [Rhodospirillaceae bacterium]